MNNPVAIVEPVLGLNKIYLFDSYLPNAFSEMDLANGNTNLTGENGAGKTSTLNLIPIFYGARPDRLIDRSANKMSFVNYYLPNQRSMIVFEYFSPVGPCCVVVYRTPNQDRHSFRFIQGSASKTIFSVDLIAFHKEHKNFKALFEEMQKIGINTSRQIDNGLDYMAVLTNDKSRISNKDLKLGDLAITFSLCGKGYEMKHIHALTQITLSKNNLLDNFKMMLVDAFLDNEDILGNRLNTLETQTLVSNLATLRQLEQEMPKIQSGIEFRRSLLEVYSKLLGSKKFSENRINEIEIHINQIAFDQDTFVSKSTNKRNELDRSISLIKSDLFEANNQLSICQTQLNTIEEQEIGYTQANIQQKRAEYRNLSHLKQLALEAKNDVEEITKNFSQINLQFDKLKNEELEKKDHRLNEINNLIGTVSTQIENLQIKKINELQNIGQVEQNQLNSFESAKELERNHIDALIESCRTKMDVEGKRTVQEKEKINDFELDIITQKKKISAKENDISLSENETRDLQNKKIKLGTDTNSVTRKLDSASQEEIEIRKILFEANTLLRFLNNSPESDWKNNIAKVIEPQLLLSKGLNPTWSSNFENEKSNFYGLELDLSKLESPMEAETTDELGARLKLCEAKVSEIKAEHANLSKQNKKVEDAIRESEQKTLKLKSELRQFRENFLTTESMFNKCVKEVNNDIEARVQICKNEISGIQEQLQIFKKNISVERQMLRQRYDAERRNTDTRFEHQLNNLRQEKNSFFDQIESVKVQHKQKEEYLLSMRNSELQNRGFDVSVLKSAESRYEDVAKHYRVVEGYAKEVSAYDHWCKYDLVRKDNLVKSISQAKENAYKLDQSLIKLKHELETYRQYFHSELSKFKAAAKSFEHQKEVLRNLCKRIDSNLDGIPGIEPISAQSNLTDDALIRVIEDSLNEQDRLEKELRQSLRYIVFILQKNTDFELYRRWQDRMDRLGAISEAARSLYSMQEIEKLVLQELQIQGELIINEFNLSAIILKNYAQALNSFKRKLNSTSKKLTEQTNLNNPFPALRDIRINLLSVMDTEANQGKKSVYDQIAQYLKDLEETQFADQGTIALPTERLVDSFEATLNAIKNLNVKTDDLYSLVKLNIHYKENDRNVDVKNDSDLASGSSTGLSRLIVIIIFTALTRQLCPNKDVVIHVPLDEISQFDSHNTTRLFELMELFNINLLCAQPNLSIELSKKFAHKHDVDRNFGIRKFEAIKNNEPNPLMDLT